MEYTLMIYVSYFYYLHLVNENNLVSNDVISQNFVPIDEYNNQFKQFCCKVCREIPQSFSYCYTKCKHLMCENCLKRGIREDNKCKICQEIIEKGTVIKITHG